MDLSYITFHSLSPYAEYQFASESIFDIIGWTPQEVLGTPCYDLFHPAEIPYLRQVHAHGLQGDKVAVVTSYRIRHKDGHWVKVETAMSVCYDALVAATTLPGSGTRVRATAAEFSDITSNLNLQKWTAQGEFTVKLQDWDAWLHTREPRICMVLNRFTADLTVMYASAACPFLLGVEAEQIIGQSFLSMIADKDVDKATDEINAAKSTSAIAYLVFDFDGDDPDYPRHIPIEAVVTCASDGLVIIMRRQTPSNEYPLQNGRPLMTSTSTAPSFDLDYSATASKLYDPSIPLRKPTTPGSIERPNSSMSYAASSLFGLINNVTTQVRDIKWETAGGWGEDSVTGEWVYDATRALEADTASMTSEAPSQKHIDDDVRR